MTTFNDTMNLVLLYRKACARKETGMLDIARLIEQECWELVYAELKEEALLVYSAMMCPIKGGCSDEHYAAMDMFLDIGYRLKGWVYYNR